MADDDLRYRAFMDLGSILSLFEGHESGSRSVTDIARSLGMFPSKVSRMLKTLETQGLFERDPDTGRYCIGARFLQVGLLYVLSHPLRPVILPHLEQVATDLRLFTSWAIFKNDRVIIVDRLRYGDNPAMHILGSEAPLHSTAYGKLFLAYLSEDEQDRILGTLELVGSTPRTITDRKSLRQELALTRDRGYALDDGQTRDGVRGLAAPVFDAHGEVAAAFSVAGGTSYITDERLPALVRHLVDKAFFISRQLGYEGRSIARPPRPTARRGRPGLRRN